MEEDIKRVGISDADEDMYDPSWGEIIGGSLGKFDVDDEELRGCVFEVIRFLIKDQLVEHANRANTAASVFDGNRILKIMCLQVIELIRQSPEQELWESWTRNPKEFFARELSEYVLELLEDIATRQIKFSETEEGKLFARIYRRLIPKGDRYRQLPSHRYSKYMTNPDVRPANAPRSGRIVPRKGIRKGSRDDR